MITTITIGKAQREEQRPKFFSLFILPEFSGNPTRQSQCCGCHQQPHSGAFQKPGAVLSEVWVWGHLQHVCVLQGHTKEKCRHPQQGQLAPCHPGALLSCQESRGGSRGSGAASGRQGVRTSSPAAPELQSGEGGAAITSSGHCDGQSASSWPGTTASVPRSPEGFHGSKKCCASSVKCLLLQHMAAGAAEAAGLPAPAWSPRASLASPGSLARAEALADFVGLADRNRAASYAMGQSCGSDARV